MAQINAVTIAAGLLEIEATLMLCRSAALQHDQQRFLERLIEARAKLGALAVEVLQDDGRTITEFFLAVDGRTPAPDAVDPVPGVVAEVRRAHDDSSSLPSSGAPHPARTEE